MARGKIRPRRRPLGESKPRFCVQGGPAPWRGHNVSAWACRSYWGVAPAACSLRFGFVRSLAACVPLAPAPLATWVRWQVDVSQDSLLTALRRIFRAPLFQKRTTCHLRLIRLYFCRGCRRRCYRIEDGLLRWRQRGGGRGADPGDSGTRLHRGRTLMIDWSATVRFRLALRDAKLRFVSVQPRGVGRSNPEVHRHVMILRHAACATPNDALAATSFCRQGRVPGAAQPRGSFRFATSAAAVSSCGRSHAKRFVAAMAGIAAKMSAAS